MRLVVPPPASARPRGRHGHIGGRKRVVTVALLGAALLAGCSSGGGTASSTFVPEPPPTVAATATDAPSAPAAAPEPTTPPRKAVPVRALLAPADLGAGWRLATPAAVGCRSSARTTASRTTALADKRGTLTETVALTPDVTQAVAAWRQALRQCGWTVDDYRLGDSGLIARTSQATVVVTGTEGVLVVLQAGPGLSGASDEIDSWADMALGTSCEAAPDGCH